MDWDDLRFFLAVARKGSIRGAAVALGVNHSTVSRRIDAFERKIGVRLFERLPSGYLLTAAGEDLLPSAQRMEEDANAIVRRVTGRDKRLGGLLRVTMPDSLAQKLLMPDLVAFSDAHPEIELEFVVSYAFADLNKREADVAIRLSNDPPGHLVGRRVVKLAKAIYASEEYLARHDPPGDPASLTWIGWNDTVRDPQWVRESAYPEAPVRNRAYHSMVQLEAAKAGMGLAMLPCFMGDTAPTIRRLPPGKAMPDRDIWLLTHEDLRGTARVRRFIDCMADTLLAKRDLLEGKCPQ
jgi:DNA-binding transcriptional LysR family regulator